ncbi:hypothetical protein V1289_009229 [Bradyrhizobium sp. AZCC 2289]
MPATTTTASGFCTCDPIPDDNAAGSRPMPATTHVIKTGRNCSSPVRRIALPRSMPSSMSWLYCEMIKTAIGGDSAGDLYEPGSDRHFPIIVRLAPQYRRSAEAIQNLRIGVQGPNGITQVPLSEVASIKLVSGAAYIYREQQERYLPIKFSVREWAGRAK